MAGTFNVGPNGFTDPNGNPWAAKGLDADLKDALQNLQGIEANYPGATMVRVVLNGNSDTLATIDPVVQAYTSKGIVVELEDHADSQGGDNTGFYTQLAQAYKGNSHVFLETPNEPSAGDTAQSQINIVNAIRATGFANPVGVQPMGGYDQSNIPTVTAAVGTSQLYVTPHIYDSSTDPADAAKYVANEVAQAKGNGLFSVTDEFGNAMDGWHMDPQGNATIDAVVKANEAGQTGAVFWAAGNGYHADGADSAFLDPTGQQLTSTGQALQPWLSGTAPAAAASPPPSAGGDNPAPSPAPSQAASAAPGQAASAAPPAAPSPDNTVVTGANGAITDASGNTWAVDAKGLVDVNGQPDTTTANVTGLAQEDGKVWQENSQGLWWEKAAPSDTWSPGAGTSTSPVPAAAPANTPAAAPAAPPADPAMTPLTTDQQAAVAGAAKSSAAGSHLLASFYEGQNAGNDLASLASKVKLDAATLQHDVNNLTGFLTSYVQSGGAGAQLGLSDKFMSDAIRNSVAALQSGDPALQKSYGAAMHTFFGNEAAAMLKMAPAHVGA